MANEDSQRDSSPRRSQGSSASAAEAARPEAIDPLIGRQLDGLSIIEPLGARVYKARQRKLQRVVAVKILPPAFSQNNKLAARCEPEARAAEWANELENEPLEAQRSRRVGPVTRVDTANCPQ